MRDGLIRRSLKLTARGVFFFNLWTSRGIRRLMGEKPHRLGGACGGCAKCCEMPGIQVGWMTWYFPTLRWIFLAWHRHVNGFELQDRDIRHRVFLFNCTHFDRETRRCDSYDSRPGMCRDYPRNQLWTANPQLFQGCGFRAIHPKSDSLLEALKNEGLEGEKLEEVKRKLHLGE